MAIKYGFFNSVNGDRKYNADDISNYFLKLISNGVFANPSNAMQVQANSGMTVQVSAGWGFINCKWINNTAPYLLTLDAADVVLNRIDRIVLRLNELNSMRTMGIYIKKGKAASSPNPPDLTRWSGDTWELSLAQIYVRAGATSISQSNITDERGNKNLCGWVTGLIDQIDTTNLFSQYNDTFNSWFKEIKEEVRSTSLVRQYTSSYTTTAANETAIPINISDYNETLDILNVYINGLKLILGVDYAQSKKAITLAKPLTVIGTKIEFEVLKSIEGVASENIVDTVYGLQTEVEKMGANNYYCNGVDDSEKLQLFIQNRQEQSNNCTINVIGNFGVKNDIVGNYSFFYGNNQDCEITLDFSQCNIIHAKGTSFGYFSNCRIKDLTIVYDTDTQADNINNIIGITAVNSTLENCNVYGALDTASTLIAYDIEDCRLIECDSDLTGYGTVKGIKAARSIVTNCNIKVASEGTDSDAKVCGIEAADTSRIDNSAFIAATASSAEKARAQGGSGGGCYSNCLFIGKGAARGEGFYLTPGILLSANNCIFRGYTKDSSHGFGIGLYGAPVSANTLILTGINCNQVEETGYSQTHSMRIEGGSGSYSGCFYSAPSVPATVVNYGAIEYNVK